ncbi:MAG: AtpZ/AtpI family protein [Myxococcales bacterium]|nr:AtpZ/AtpI family protein [Myxococcales bacterium]
MWLQAASLSYLGIFFGVSLVIGAAIGSFLDRKWGTHPYLMMVGVVLGIATGFNELWRLAKRYQNKLKQKS